MAAIEREESWSSHQLFSALEVTPTTPISIFDLALSLALDLVSPSFRDPDARGVFSSSSRAQSSNVLE